MPTTHRRWCRRYLHSTRNMHVRADVLHMNEFWLFSEMDETNRSISDCHWGSSYVKGMELVASAICVLHLFSVIISRESRYGNNNFLGMRNRIDIAYRAAIAFENENRRNAFDRQYAVRYYKSHISIWRTVEQQQKKYLVTNRNSAIDWRCAVHYDNPRSNRPTALAVRSTHLLGDGSIDLDYEVKVIQKWATSGLLASIDHITYDDFYVSIIISFVFLNFISGKR